MLDLNQYIDFLQVIM